MATSDALPLGKFGPLPEVRETPPDRHVRRRWKVWVRSLIGVAVLLLVGGAVTRLASRPTEPPIHYRTLAIDRGPVRAKVTANGALSALVTVSVGSQVSGRIETLKKDFGSRVKKGEVIATIDPDVFRAAAEQARANLAAALAAVERAAALEVNAERQYYRSRDLHAEGLVTGAEYEEAEATLGVARADLTVAKANVKQARAARDQAEQNLGFTTIVSPIDGIVISRNVDVGQTVVAALQTPTLFTIAQDLTHMQVDTNVAEADIGKIREGMRVEFTVDAHPGRTFIGRLRQVRDNAQTLQNVVTYDAVVDVDNGEGLLKPGMTANVTFTHAERADVLRVPNAALRFKPDAAVLSAMTDAGAPAASRGDERTLWLLRAGRAVPIAVRVGITDGTSTEIVTGDARAGDSVIVEATGESVRPSP
jgi:HlyD family secretion protein